MDLRAGTYVVAVSGGVDSIALLDMLAKLTTLDRGLRLVVAHYDHGIREDSAEDRRLVATAAKRYGLPFVYHEGRLGPGTSEAVARDARYAFLQQVQAASAARAIVTAHHQDDVLETVLLNIMRGTGRKGFSSLRSTDVVRRPLLHMTKTQLKEYAQKHQLAWREDSTNQDLAYRRNYLRHKVLPRLTPQQRQELLDSIKHMHEVNDEIDQHLAVHLHVQPARDKLNRKHFIMLPHALGLELLASWLRHHDIRNFDSKTLHRLSLAAKTLQPGQVVDVNHAWKLQISKDHLALVPRDR